MLEASNGDITTVATVEEVTHACFKVKKDYKI